MRENAPNSATQKVYLMISELDTETQAQKTGISTYKLSHCMRNMRLNARRNIYNDTEKFENTADPTWTSRDVHFYNARKRPLG